ncbi:TetR/AcrR family transcriptional regulator [Mycobacterium sp. ML4]
MAAQLLARRGPSVPLAEIAEAAGVGVGTLYRGYPDRDALLRALQLRGYEMLVAVLDHIAESGLTGADAVETFLGECLNLGDQLVLPLRGAAPLLDDAAIEARGRINAALERLLAEGRAQGSVRAGVNGTDIIMCGAMISQPLPHGPGWSAIARRHIRIFVDGIRAPGGQPLPAPAVTQDDIEAMFRADATARAPGTRGNSGQSSQTG